MSKAYTYRIDLDERGEFRAHVENTRGKTVFEIHEPRYSCWVCGQSPKDCRCDVPEIVQDTTIFDDGFMRHGRDIAGLADYLRDLAIMPKSCILVAG